MNALVRPEIGAWHLLPIVALVVLCGLADRTIFLAARVVASLLPAASG